MNQCTSENPPSPAPSPNFPSPSASGSHSPDHTLSQSTKRLCEGFDSLNEIPEPSCFLSVHPEQRSLCLPQLGRPFFVHLCCVGRTPVLAFLRTIYPPTQVLCCILQIKWRVSFPVKWKRGLSPEEKAQSFMGEMEKVEQGEMREYIILHSPCPPMKQHAISLQINQIIDSNNTNYPASSVLEDVFSHYHCSFPL